MTLHALQAMAWGTVSTTVLCAVLLATAHPTTTSPGARPGRTGTAAPGLGARLHVGATPRAARRPAPPSRPAIG